MNKKVISLSVVIPTYNRSQLVVRAVNSVITQNEFVPMEIIILDDASNDNTIQTLEDIKRSSDVPIVIYKSDVNVGPSKLRNIGITMSQGDFVAFLDSDDIWTEHKLQVFTKELKKFPDLKIWTHKFGAAEEAEKISDISTIVPYWKQLLKNRASCPCTIIKKGINQKFSEDLNYNEDHEFFTRISYSYPLYLNQSVLTLLNRKVNDRGGLSGNIWKMRSGEIKTYLKARSYNRMITLFVPGLILFSLLKHLRLLVRKI